MSTLYQSAAANVAGYRDVDPVTVARLRGQLRIIDVREPHEFSGELGHIEGSELVPLATIERAARSWDKGEEIVLICRSGARSARAAAALAAAGFKRLMNMSGGMLAWNAAKFPIER